jgi:hypothetical protein
MPLAVIVIVGAVGVGEGAGAGAGLPTGGVGETGVIDEPPAQAAVVTIAIRKTITRITASQTACASSRSSGRSEGGCRGRSPARRVF